MKHTEMAKDIIKVGQLTEELMKKNPGLSVVEAFNQAKAQLEKEGTARLKKEIDKIE